MFALRPTSTTTGVLGECNSRLLREARKNPEKQKYVLEHLVRLHVLGQEYRNAELKE